MKRPKTTAGAIVTLIAAVAGTAGYQLSPGVREAIDTLIRVLVGGALVVALAACSGTAQQAMSTIAERGAAAADAQLEQAEWQLCEAGTVGAVRRRYGSDEELLGAYRTICTYSDHTETVNESVAAAGGNPNE